MTLSYAQVVHGRHDCLDPMLLEAHCIPQDAKTREIRQPEDMAVEVALRHAITNQSRRHKLHPTKRQPCEHLPEDFYRNYAGFLLRDTKREIEVDEETVRA